MGIKIAIIGKTNTGKSTLFNRIIGYRKAIVLAKAGITRDRNYADILWEGKSLTLIDTGGIDYHADQGVIQEKIIEQSRKAIEESDIILYLLDFMTGIQQEDIDFIRFIRKKGKKVILVINKSDIKKKNYFPEDFYQLGFGDPCFISAEQGLNIDKLLDMIIKMTSYKDVDVQDNNLSQGQDRDKIIKVAIIGKPNVGKSSIVNALLNEDRMIVDDYPGTTRDAIEASIYFNSYKIVFVDTSGLRRRKNVNEDLEYYSNTRTIHAIQNSDIVILVLDASQCISMQDKRLANRIIEEKKACIVLLNKYDLILQQKEIGKDVLLKMAKYELRFLKNVTILTSIAVGPRKNISKIQKSIIEIYHESKKKILTSQLNKLLQEIVSKYNPKIVKGKRLRFFYITQTGVKPLEFIIFVNNPDLLNNFYQRYLENQLTEQLGIKGLPVIFRYHKKTNYKRAGLK